VLSKFAAPPRGENANEPVQRSQAQIGAIAKAKSFGHEKIEVIAVINRRERIEPLKNEVPGFEFSLRRFQLPQEPAGERAIWQHCAKAGKRRSEERNL
jgi:hypothetical protein